MRMATLNSDGNNRIDEALGEAAAGRIYHAAELARSGKSSQISSPYLDWYGSRRVDRGTKSADCSKLQFLSFGFEAQGPYASGPLVWIHKLPDSRCLNQRTKRSSVPEMLPVSISLLPDL